MTPSHDNEVEEPNEEVVNAPLQDEEQAGLQVQAASKTLNKDVLGLNYHDLHFGTKEAPAKVQSLYNRKIVGCPGATEEGHDMVWFWLDKDKPHECAVCSQFFELEVVGIGGQPEVEGGHCHDHP